MVLFPVQLYDEQESVPGTVTREKAEGKRKKAELMIVTKIAISGRPSQLLILPFAFLLLPCKKRRGKGRSYLSFARLIIVTKIAISGRPS
jgi:hypothetical protein